MGREAAMDNTIKTILIAVSLITGLLFAAVLCYVMSVAFIYSAQNDNTQSSAVNVTAITLEAATDEPASTAPPPTSPPPTQAIPNNPPAVNPAPPADDLTWNGLHIDITGINYNAWPLIKAQNSHNEPPLEGKTMLMITARVTNVEGDSEEPVSLMASDFQLIGDNKTVYKTFQVSCGVVPDNLDGVVALGHSLDGNICFQVPRDESNFQLIYEPFGSPAVYLAIPQRDDTGWTPPEPPPPLLESEELTWDGLKLDIVDIDYNAWPLIKAENSNNDPPLNGMQMLLITLRATNLEGAPEEAIALREHLFKLIGDRKTVYETFEVSCGVIPNEINSVVMPNHFTEGNICFQVSEDEEGFQLIYESFDSPAVYIKLPPRNPGK